MIFYSCSLWSDKHDWCGEEDGENVSTFPLRLKSIFCTNFFVHVAHCIVMSAVIPALYSPWVRLNGMFLFRVFHTKIEEQSEKNSQPTPEEFYDENASIVHPLQSIADGNGWNRRTEGGHRTHILPPWEMAPVRLSWLIIRRYQIERGRKGICCISPRDNSNLSNIVT